MTKAKHPSRRTSRTRSADAEPGKPDPDRSSRFALNGLSGNETTNIGEAPISFRLPAAFLQSLNGECRIVLDEGPSSGMDRSRKATGARERRSLTVIRKGGEGGGDTFSARPDAASPTIKVFSEGGGEGGLSREDVMDLQYRGTALKRYRVEPSEFVNFDEIGRRARQRSLEEKYRRKEIVRLESDPPSMKRKGAVAMKLGGSDVDPKKKAKTVPPRPAVPADDDGRPCRVDVQPRDDRSSVVRLHGLPRGCTPDGVRKFFAGLDPERIFALPRHDRPVPKLDGTGGDDRKKRETGVEREPETLRVYVKFPSAPVARAAAERSGEAMRVDARGQEGIRGASVAVTHVPKNAASFILKYLVIDSVKGQPFRETVSNAQHDLPPQVSSIVWAMSARALNLTDGRTRTQRSLRWDGSFHDVEPPSNENDCQKLILEHNDLLDMHRQLEMDGSPLFMHLFDPSAPYNPVQRLTTAVATWMLDEARMIDSVVTCYRHGQMN